MGVACYTAVGAYVFKLLENPNERETLETYQALLVSKRELFLRSLWNISRNTVNYQEVNYYLMMVVLDSQLFFPRSKWINC